MAERISYRKDIQILRGVAVLLVVLFHLKITGFDSGFLGVDVFFVISGYLMAVMYDPQHTSDFYKKRARRLLPAYFTVTFLSVLAAIFLTNPSEYNQVSEQAVYAAFLSSNMGFWTGFPYWENSYFRPLLHLWSLGVEIQFYLVVPLIYWVYKRFRYAIPALTILSLVSCMLALSVSPKTAFFLLPFRLWQFLFGFIAAKYTHEVKRAQPLANPWLGAFFAFCILCIPLIRVDGVHGGILRGHPGIPALLVSLVVTGVLFTGVPKWIEDNYVSNILERIGKYSYSIYLAHFPVIVFYLYTPFAGTVLDAGNPSDLTWLILLTICASALLFSLVESPMRSAGFSLKAAVILPLSVLVCVFLGIQLQKVLIPEKEMLIYQSWFDRSDWRCGKMNRLLHPADEVCEIKPTVAAPDLRIFLVGDSHAESIKGTFLDAARSENAAVYYVAGNDPLYGGGITPGELIQEVDKRGADAIVLHFLPSNLQPAVLYELVSLAAARQIDVAFILPVPAWKEHIPEALIANLDTGRELPVQTIEDYRMLHQPTFDMIAKVEYDKFRVYSVADVLCTPVCQVISDDGKPYYFDYHHLTLTGSALLRDVFLTLIADLK